MLNMPFASLISISDLQLKNLQEVEFIEAGSTLTNNPNVEFAPKSFVMRTFQTNVSCAHFTIVVKRTRQVCQMMVLGYA